ncbi:MAG: 2OG-Fe(II) oxygenase [Gammaproteobacteria bacterium]|nr:MAG: 2OG-Fe(II) oxygenase [Gammaproteobacteria bacterium]UCH42042.1 MAG: 2OG-Fe(II) oxygenase [Gammaproteobacteria bacterium]
MVAYELSSNLYCDEFNQALFERIARDIEKKGYSINPAALPIGLSAILFDHVIQMSGSKFENAGIGRERQYMKNHFVRSDEICWINGESDAGTQWLNWATQLQAYLNRRLFLGLFSFESHFAHYSPGDYYKRHVDAFNGKTNRILSLATYLNPEWLPEDGGELVLYRNQQDRDGIRVTPVLGTLVVFLSEEFPHEVLVSNQDRYSIAGWFRVNCSIENRPDPPL